METAIQTHQNTPIDLELQMKIAALKDAILTAHPTMPTLLAQIHKQLKADPVSVTLMSEEDIAVIISGLSAHTKTEIIASAVKAKGKALKNLSADDL